MRVLLAVEETGVDPAWLSSAGVRASSQLHVGLLDGSRRVFWTYHASALRAVLGAMCFGRECGVVEGSGEAGIRWGSEWGWLWSYTDFVADGENGQLALRDTELLGLLGELAGFAASKERGILEVGFEAVEPHVGWRGGEDLSFERRAFRERLVSPKGSGSGRLVGSDDFVDGDDAAAGAASVGVRQRWLMVDGWGFEFERFGVGGGCYVGRVVDDGGRLRAGVMVFGSSVSVSSVFRVVWDEAGRVVQLELRGPFLEDVASHVLPAGWVFDDPFAVLDGARFGPGLELSLDCGDEVTDRVLGLVGAALETDVSSLLVFDSKVSASVAEWLALLSGLSCLRLLRAHGLCSFMVHAGPRADRDGDFEVDTYAWSPTHRGGGGGSVEFSPDYSSVVSVPGVGHWYWDEVLVSSGLERVEFTAWRPGQPEVAELLAAHPGLVVEELPRRDGWWFPHDFVALRSG